MQQSDTHRDTGLFTKTLICPIGQNLDSSQRTLIPYNGTLGYNTSDQNLYFGIGTQWKLAGSGLQVDYTAVPPIAATDNNSIIIDNINHEIGLEFADVSHNGIVSTVAQEYGGVKTFRGIIVRDEIDFVQEPSTSTAGNITKAGTRFLHDFGLNNLFLGLNGGNFTLTGIDNNGFGSAVLTSLTTGEDNNGFGSNVLTSLTTGDNNTAMGDEALSSNSTASNNSAYGSGALASSTTGYNNTAIGTFAMNNTTTGRESVAVGQSALLDNTTGIFNTAIGPYAMQNNTTGSFNTCVGYAAGINGITATNNVCVGLNSFSTGSFNTLVGSTTGDNGDRNTAVGYNVMSGCSSSQNVGVGYGVMATSFTNGNNTGIGYQALRRVRGTGNTALGFQAGQNSTLAGSNNNIYINNDGTDESDTIRIGSSQTRNFQVGIRGVVTSIADAVNVVIDSGNQLGTVSSDRRLKDDIKPMGTVKEIIRKLNPCFFNYRSDKTKKITCGFIADEFEKVLPMHTVLIKQGEDYKTIQYDKVVIYLTKEVQRLQNLTDKLASMLDVDCS